MHNGRLANSVHRYIEKYYQQEDGPDRYDLDNIITVKAEVSRDFLHCAQDFKGAMHQHFYISIKEVVEGGIDPVENKPTFVAVHYGDEDGIPGPIPNLQPGRPITIRGKYIPADEAFRTLDNPCYPVLHFTHHPVGYVIYEGTKYE